MNYQGIKINAEAAAREYTSKKAKSTLSLNSRLEKQVKFLFDKFIFSEKKTKSKKNFDYFLVQFFENFFNGFS